jgi:hypothetical protein
MGSADHQFNLAEILSQNYSLREGCAEASRCPDKPEEELDKDFISQVWVGHCLLLIWVLCGLVLRAPEFSECEAPCWEW